MFSKFLSGTYLNSNLTWLSLPPKLSLNKTGLVLSLSNLFNILFFSFKK